MTWKDITQTAGINYFIKSTEKGKEGETIGYKVSQAVFASLNLCNTLSKFFNCSNPQFSVYRLRMMIAPNSYFFCEL